MFANHEERCVNFRPLGTWVVGEGGPFKFTLDSDVVISPWDYIALYKVPLLKLFDVKVGKGQSRSERE